MNKKLLYLTTIILTLAGCSSEEYIGAPSLHEANDTPPIQFDGGTEVITRATSNTGTAPHKLDYQFKLYGVKSGATAETNMQNVFINYSVWYDDNTANTTTSNSSNWEYVGDIGTHGTVTLTSEQTIKYWDYSAYDYRFVAGSPVSAFTYNVTSTTEPTVKHTIATASVTGLAGHINAHPIIDESTKPLATNPVYVAKPKIITSAHYREPVIFQFVRQQAQVRVGIYETIPGYIISDIHFYTQVYNADTQESSWSTTRESGNSVVLASTTPGYFAGGSSVPGTIYYDWDNLTFTYAYGAGVTKAQNWYGGVFKPTDTDAAVKATSSTDAGLFGVYGYDANGNAIITGADADMAANGFFTVLPTPSETAQPILIKCDYTLKSVEDNSNETIEVTGATAAIPAAFCKWAPNTMYTYLFKISDNTNGSTGQNKTGLYPITFAAVESDGGSMGTTTVVSAPSITTYQEGSVVDQEADDTVVPPVEAFHGIKYVTGKPIYVTVADGTTEDHIGDLLPLNNTDATVGCIKVYSIGTTEKTEADMQVTAPAESTAITPTFSADAVTVGTATLPASETEGSYYYVAFTPTTAGYYVIQYLTEAASGSVPAVYTYKVVYVE